MKFQILDEKKNIILIFFATREIAFDEFYFCTLE